MASTWFASSCWSRSVSRSRSRRIRTRAVTRSSAGSTRRTPGNAFAPAPGRVTRFVPPLGPGIRVDTAVESGSVISERYDSMIAKLVATGPCREIAIARMRRALDEIVIEGVPSTIPLHRNVMASSAFQDAGLSTSFLMDVPR